MDRATIHSRTLWKSHNKFIIGISQMFKYIFVIPLRYIFTMNFINVIQLDWDFYLDISNYITFEAQV